jgi:hypothetical protein
LLQDFPLLDFSDLVGFCASFIIWVHIKTEHYVSHSPGKCLVRFSLLIQNLQLLAFEILMEN